MVSYHNRAGGSLGVSIIILSPELKRASYMVPYIGTGAGTGNGTNINTGTGNVTRPPSPTLKPTPRVCVARFLKHFGVAATSRATGGGDGMHG